MMQDRIAWFEEPGSDDVSRVGGGTTRHVAQVEAAAAKEIVQ